MSVKITSSVYVIDSSALIDLKDLYPKSVFENVWSKLTNLIQINRMISSTEVFREIKKKEDDLLSWCKANSRMFVGTNEEHLKIVEEIMKKYPKLVKHDTLHPVADPFVIAVAKVLKDQNLDAPIPIVVTHEKREENVKMPTVCIEYGVENMRLLEMFEAEGWKF